MGNKCNQKSARKRIQTSKLVDRLFLSSSKTKAGKGSRRVTRDVLKNSSRSPMMDPTSYPTLKFGSFNVRGLDTEAFWYIEELVTDRGFDVRVDFNKLYEKLF